jgi:hypothetical protein
MRYSFPQELDLALRCHGLDLLQLSRFPDGEAPPDERPGTLSAWRVMELGIRPEPPQINSALPPLLGGGSNRAMSALSPESTVIPVNGIPRTRIKFRNFNRRFSSRSLDGTICLNYGRKPDEETYFNSCYVFGVSCDHHRFLSRGERDCPNSGPDCSISGVAMCWFERRCCNFCLYRGNQAKLRKLEIIQ